MKIKKIVLFAFIGINILFFSGTAYYCAHYKFLKTTGFYFSGLDYNLIGLINANGFDKHHKPVRKINCFHHNHTFDNAIYNDWRFDFMYYDLIDSISLTIPDTLIGQIETVWYKYDKTVNKYTLKEFLDVWHFKKENKLLHFSIPQSLVQANTFFDGVKCLIFNKGFFFKVVRYVFSLSILMLFILLLLYFYRFLEKRCKNVIVYFKSVCKKHSGLFNRILVVFLGLFFAFLFLEMALRLAGYFHNKAHIENQYQRKVNTKNRVLCVGDSFTEGIGATKGNDYPSQLELLLNSNTEKTYSVLNFGRSGKNTAQFLLEIPSYLENYKPEFLILLAGNANYWNFWGYTSSNNIFEKFRVFTFFKLIFQNIKNEKQKDFFNQKEYISRRGKTALGLKSKPPMLSSQLEFLIEQENVEKHIDSCYNLGLLNEDEIVNILIFSMLFEKHEILKTSIKNYVPVSNRAEFCFFLMDISSDKFSKKVTDFSPLQQSVYYFVDAMKKGEINRTTLENCIKLNPYFEDPYLQYYTLGNEEISLPSHFKTYRFSLYDTINYYRTLFKMDYANYNFNFAFIDNNLEGSLNTKNIDSWVMNDLNSIIDLCKQKNVKLILMNYPVLNNSALFYSVNDVLKRTAHAHNIPFVDNEALFDKIVLDRSSYFISDGHCSDLGYQFMARNIYNLMSEEQLKKE